MNPTDKIRRILLTRKMESFLRFRGKQMVSIGDNNVSFFRPGWTTVDLINADYCCDVRYEPLPFDDASIDIINCSHLIEHISSDCAIHLFGEAYRCLKRDGIIRISTPDLDEIITRYRNDDWLFFIKANGRDILNNIVSDKLPADSILLPNLFVQWLASYSGRLDSAGGPIVSKECIDMALEAKTKYQFRDWCVSLLEKGRTYAHIHVYDFEELCGLLREIGFKSVVRTSFSNSKHPIIARFNIDNPCHRSYSLYLEASK